MVVVVVVVIACWCWLRMPWYAVVCVVSVCAVLLVGGLVVGHRSGGCVVCVAGDVVHSDVVARTARLDEFVSKYGPKPCAMPEEAL